MANLLAGNVLVVQVECLSPVSNAVLGGIISGALNYERVEEIYGSVNGFCGILNRDLIDLASQPQQIVRDLTFTPGAALGTFDWSDRSTEEIETLFSAFEEYNIRFLFTIGGPKTQSIALELFQMAQQRAYAIQIISIPDTIYNDLPITDHSLGYGSVSKFITTTIRELSCYTAAVANHDLVNVIEIAADKSNWLMASALLNVTPFHIVLLPSENFSEEKFLKAVQNVLKSNHYCCVIASDFLVNDEGNYISGKTIGTAEKLKEILEESLEVRVLTTKLGALQYSAAHFLSKTDVDEAYACGVKAVGFALDGLAGKMVTILRSEGNRYGVEYGMADLANICGHEKSIPNHWFDEGGKLNANFSKYALPLIQGNVVIPENNGLPKFATLKK
ncbi:MAG: diphosphate--fructose-6-phosphate 1-phosphotransferase [Puniceicoccales bacterium]|jgi:6-phosphofructokinase 1|nr:diphosphate--fructose-6-phosphate 1-phosphotransferase [Puniceicoccales bacterium]